MFSYISGIVEHIGEASLVLECNGIGYYIQVPGSAISKVQHKGQAKIYTQLNVRDDGIHLYGFVTKEEQDMFSLLTSVTGIGPKAALNILSILTPSQITLAIVTDDSAAFSKAPGVGKKTAQRISMELRDKVKNYDAVANIPTNPQQPISMPVAGSAKQDALDALIALGYGRSEAVKSILEVATEGMETEKIIKAALKKLL